MAQFSDLKHQIITDIQGLGEGSEMVTFNTKSGAQYKMFHSQDCCETVDIYDVIGDVDDLLNSRILQAEEVVNQDIPDEVKEEDYESLTWTFYKLATIKGSVTIRWLGTSNGYYSESVDFECLKEGEPEIFLSDLLPNGKASVKVAIRHYLILRYIEFYSRYRHLAEECGANTACSFGEWMYTWMGQEEWLFETFKRGVAEEEKEQREALERPCRKILEEHGTAIKLIFGAIESEEDDTDEIECPKCHEYYSLISEGHNTDAIKEKGQCVGCLGYCPYCDEEEGEPDGKEV